MRSETEGDKDGKKETDRPTHTERGQRSTEIDLYIVTKVLKSCTRLQTQMKS